MKNLDPQFLKKAALLEREDKDKKKRNKFFMERLNFQVIEKNGNRN